MEYDWIIIDGYSLLYRTEHKITPLPTARQWLARQVEPALGRWAPRITLVYDGRAEGGLSLEESIGVEVVFAPGHQTADTVIERWVHQAPAPARILVVTSDRAERDVASAGGAQTMAAGDFLTRCRQPRRPTMASREPAARPFPGKLGDLFPS